LFLTAFFAKGGITKALYHTNWKKASQNLHFFEKNQKFTKNSQSKGTRWGNPPLFSVKTATKGRRKAKESLLRCKKIKKGLD
jgi:hypothetical protein